MPTVVIRHDLPIADALEGRRDDLTVITAPDDEAVATALPDAEIFVTSPGSWREAYLEALGPGDWFQATSAGYAAYSVEAFRERGIRFTNATGNYGPVVAEHVFALAFAFSRRLPMLLEMQREHHWDRSAEISLRLSDWTDHGLTVLGLGNIGEAIAQRGLAFEMTVHGIKRRPADYDGCLSPERVHPPEAFLDRLAETDLLVVSVPLTDETRHMVDGSAFAALPDNAVLVNVARGPVVDEAAMLAALRAGELAGAGLDVFEEEPLPDESPLWDREDVIISPHVGGRSNTFPDRFADLFLENYDRWAAGDPLVNEVA